MELAKGLKKGDIFEEAGRYFVVEEVLENGNYISSEIKKPEEKPEEKPKRAKKTKAEQSVPEHEENVPEDKENVPDEEEDKEE